MFKYDFQYHLTLLFHILIFSCKTIPNEGSDIKKYYMQFLDCKPIKILFFSSIDY